jgi:bifunctional non-homologous end joining protein LigD
MPLDEYHRKRDFTLSPEPSGDGPKPGRRQPAATADGPTWSTLPEGHRYCVQQHRATRMHFDFRLEHNGVLMSWPIPRGPTLDPSMRRLAVQTEDHPVDYGDFEGVIPSGYGAGTVLLWDIGTYEWLRETAADFDASYAKGDLKFRLSGVKLSGEFALVKLGRRGRNREAGSDDDRNWLMIKKRDDAVNEKYEALDHAVSVKTGRTLAQIAADGGGDPREAARSRRAAGTTRAAAVADGRATSGQAANARGGAARGDPKPPPLPSPMLATSVDRPFSREGWFFELKWDGVRALAEVSRAGVRIVGRSGRDETQRYPELSALRDALRGVDAIVDGEIVVLDDDGRPSFERLQSRINVSRGADVRNAAQRNPARLVVFDILALDGRDLMSTSLRIRKKTLHDVLHPSDVILYADHVEGDGLGFFKAVQQRGIEGMIAKRADSTYQPGRRSPDWLKVKSWQTQSCVIAGYTSGRGRRTRQLGALILGVHDGDGLRHCGQVGTGFDEATLATLRAHLDRLTTDGAAIHPAPRTTEPATWVRPELVCEVRHAGWTRQGILRHPAFLALRSDLDPTACRREVPAPVPDVLAAGEESARPPAATGDQAAAAPAGGRRRRSRGSGQVEPVPTGPVAHDALLTQLRALRGNDTLDIDGHGVRLTNLDKVMWPEEHLTKRDLVAHYIAVAPVLLPYLRDRPLSMQMFPDGITGKSFWRKDAPSHAPGWMKTWTYHGEKTKNYIVVDDLATLVWVANAASIDLHPWHSRIDEPTRPDWAVFDLDPAEGATFESVVTIARLVGVALQHYKLRSVLKTTGQTGLQIYVPISRGPEYSAVLTWVEGVARTIGQAVPDLVSWEWTVSKRTGRVRIDYTQNIINKTLNAPYTVRATPHATVSAPIRWDELDDPTLRSDRWTVATIGRRIAAVGDLFGAALQGGQDLPPLD